MKKFYFTTETKNKKYSQEKTGAIYQLKNNDLVFCCNYEYNTGSCRGDKSEVFNTLLENNFIPKKYTGDKYFFCEVTKKYSITSL
jgi:hypothetical protein